MVVDGVTLPPVARTRASIWFVLPAGAGNARLRSRSGCPADLAPWTDDRRRLGIAVAGMTIEAGGHVRSIPADHPGLTDGWHPPECDGARKWRWTDGDALLPAAFLSGLVGPAVVEISIGVET